jgi:protein-disulfide isomerase
MWIRQSLRQGGGALALATIALAASVAISGCGGGDSHPSSVHTAADVSQMLEGIPQQGVNLGDPKALVTLVEFGDLYQCPVCKKYAEGVLPEIVASEVRNGEARLAFSDYAPEGGQSAAMGAAAIAAGEQRRAWNFIELLYLDKESEGPNAASDSFLTEIAKRAGVKDIARWNSERKGKRIAQIVVANTERAKSLLITEVPTFAPVGPASYSEFGETLKPNGSAKQLETAIAEVAIYPGEK